MKKQITAIILIVASIATIGLSALLMTLPLSKASVIDGNGQLTVGSSVFDFSNTALSGSDAQGYALSHTDASLPQEFDMDLYRITTTTECTSEITVTLDVPSKLLSLPESRTLLLGIGSPVEFADGTVRTSMQYKEVTAEGGKVTATFNPSAFTSLSVTSTYLNGGGEAKTDKGYVFDIGLTIGEVYFNDGHFKVYFPGLVENYGVGFISKNVGVQIISDLEKAFKQFAEGNDYTPVYELSERKWPMSVYISDLGDNAAEFVISKKNMVMSMDFTENAKFGYIAINRNHIESGYSSETVSPFLVHEFFHFVQQKYISGDYPVTWFNEATSSYYEYMDNKITPDSLTANEELLLNGVYPKTNTAADGYARSSLLYYLTNRYGKDYILENYKLLGNGNYNAAFAQTSNKESTSVWVADFYQKHLSGNLFKPREDSLTPYNIYVGLKVGETLGMRTDLKYSEKTSLSKTAPVYGKGTLSVQGYGVRFLRLDISDSEITKFKDGDAFKISCDNQSITLFAFVIDRNRETNKIINTLIKGSSPVIQDAKSVLAAKKMLLVCAVNISNEETTAEIKVQPTDAKIDYSGTYTGIMTEEKTGETFEARVVATLYYTIGNESEYNVSFYYNKNGIDYHSYGRFLVKWPAGTIETFGDEYAFSVDNKGISLIATLKDFNGKGNNYCFDVRKNI